MTRFSFLAALLVLTACAAEEAANNTIDLSTGGSSSAATFHSEQLPCGDAPLVFDTGSTMSIVTAQVCFESECTLLASGVTRDTTDPGVWYVECPDNYVNGYVIFTWLAPASSED